MARRRRTGRVVNGILLLDKPAGQTSNQALQRLRRLYQTRRAGHTGSLDKPATGLLIICFGQATKCSAYLLAADKTYHMFCRLGSRTTTGDASGEVLERVPVPALRRADIERLLRGFVGAIQQVPPMYSALKYKGQRLHQLARAGREVPRPARKVHIHAIRLLGHDDTGLELQVDCSKGAYMRTLAEDIGAALGCAAHVSWLRRLRCGPFRAEQMHDFAAMERAAAEGGAAALDALLLSPESALPDWPALHLLPQVANYFCQGQAVVVPGAPTEGMVRVHGADGAMIAIAEVQDDGRIAPRRLFLS